MSIKDDALIIGGIALAVIGIAWWMKNKIANGALNPASDKNVAYQAVNGFGSALTGDSSFDFGGSLWDAFNPGTNAKINAMLAGSQTAVPQTGGASGDW